MSVIHFLNVLEGDCNIIQHDSTRITVIDVSNADNGIDTLAEKAKKESQMRKVMFTRNYVPSNKVNYQQKHTPDNPIAYLKKLGVKSIHRFIITHPDMDHLDGIQDLYSEFSIVNTWDTDNNCEKEGSFAFGGFNKEDWDFYKKLRAGQANTRRLTYYAGDSKEFYNQDYITILGPTKELLAAANDCGKFNDSSYVLLYTPPKATGGYWKFLFAGDSEDATWEYILKYHRQLVTNVDVLFAPHHGRDSGRSYDFLDVLTPTYTIFGNASSDHLAYDSYRRTRITNNQAGYIIFDIQQDHYAIYVKNKEFATNFTHNKGWEPVWEPKFDAYGIIQHKAK